MHASDDESSSFHQAAVACYKITGLYPLVHNVAPEAMVSVAYVVCAIVLFLTAIGMTLILCRKMQEGVIHRVWFHCCDFSSHILYIPLLGKKCVLYNGRILAAASCMRN